MLDAEDKKIASRNAVSSGRQLSRLLWEKSGVRPLLTAGEYDGGHAFVLLQAITQSTLLVMSTSTQQNGYIVTYPVQPTSKPYLAFCAERVTLRFPSTGLGAGGSTIVSHSSESGGGRSSTARGFGLLFCTGGSGGVAASTGTWCGGDSST